MGGLEIDSAQKEAILGRYQSLSQLNPEAANAIKAVYESAAIQGLIADKEQKLDLDDNAFYFLEKVDAMGKSDFLPSTEDILKVRDPTRTIETLDFQYGKAKFRVIDVGGQRMERPKWNLTGEITAVIFVCALTEYNQVLREDIKQNRLKESLNLFDIACKRRSCSSSIRRISSRRRSRRPTSRSASRRTKAAATTTPRSSTSNGSL